MAKSSTNTTNQVPNRLLAFFGVDQPFVDSAGRLNTWSAQALMRLVGYIGPTGSSSSKTLTQQIATATTIVEGLAGKQAMLPFGPPPMPPVGPLPPAAPVSAGAQFPPLLPYQAANTSMLPYDVAGYVPGPVGAPGSALFDFVVVRPFLLPVSLVGSIAKCLIAPGASVTMNLQKNGATIGSINFAASSTTGTFTFGSPVGFQVNDSLALASPAMADTVFAGLAFTLAGQRPT